MAFETSVPQRTRADVDADLVGGPFRIQISCYVPDGTAGLWRIIVHIHKGSAHTRTHSCSAYSLRHQNSMWNKVFHKIQTQRQCANRKWREKRPTAIAIQALEWSNADADQILCATKSHAACEKEKTPLLGHFPFWLSVRVLFRTEWVCLYKIADSLQSHWSI